MMPAITVVRAVLPWLAICPVEPTVQRNVAYVQPADALRRLDVYAPPVGRSQPVVIWVHGGGWQTGDKTHVQLKPRAFVDRGYVFVSVNYRLAPQVDASQMAADVAKAIGWVRDHAARYGGAADKLFIAGHSAGAHLAALVSTDGSYLEAEGLSLAAIRGCISVDTAAYDIPEAVETCGPILRRVYLAAFGTNVIAQRRLSPIAHLAADKNIPAFLILPVADRADSAAQSRAFADALTNAGIHATVVQAEGKSHGAINRDLGVPGDEPTKAVFAFLDRLSNDR